ncbi:hypothetical protein P7266_1769 [Lactococcus cremoris]|nr:hypothetical protein P7266_1769 [Lactococcus cremoris]
MNPARFWQAVDEYLKETSVSLSWLNINLGFRDGYLKMMKRKNSIPSSKKLMKFKNILSDDILYEVITSRAESTKDAETVRLIDDFMLSLNISDEMRGKQRLKRKLMRQRL